MDDHFDICPYLVSKHFLEDFCIYVLWHIDLFTILFLASIHRNIINSVFSMIMGFLKIMGILEIRTSAFCIMKQPWVYWGQGQNDVVWRCSCVWILGSQLIILLWETVEPRGELKACQRKQITGIGVGFHSPEMSLVHSLFLYVFLTTDVSLSP